ARTAWAADELESQILALYDVSSDGRTHVTLQARIVNNDPTTTRRGTAGYYYTAFRFFVHAANAGLVARADGTRLDIETIDSSLFQRLRVRYHRGLYLQESVDLTIEYDLTSVRLQNMLVRREYAFVPAITQGTRSLVRITASDDRTLTMVESPNCGRTREH